MIPHEPFLAFTRKNAKRKNNDNVGYVNDTVSRLLEFKSSSFFHHSAAMRRFSAFGLFLSLFVVVMAQILHKEGAW